MAVGTKPLRVRAGARWRFGIRGRGGIGHGDLRLQFRERRRRQAQVKQRPEKTSEQSPRGLRAQGLGYKSLRAQRPLEIATVRSEPTTVMVQM